MDIYLMNFFLWLEGNNKEYIKINDLYGEIPRNASEHDISVICLAHFFGRNIKFLFPLINRSYKLRTLVMEHKDELKLSKCAEDERYSSWSTQLKRANIKTTDGFIRKDN